MGNANSLFIFQRHFLNLELRPKNIKRAKIFWEALLTDWKVNKIAEIEKGADEK